MSTLHCQAPPHGIKAVPWIGIPHPTYWMKCRIRAASEALWAGNEPIIAISQRLGFCDQSNFTHHFRRHTGLTPAAALKQANAPRSFA